MGKIIPILSTNDLKKFADVCYYAYPGFGTTKEQLIESFQRVNNEDKDSVYFAYKEDEYVLGGMRLIDYRMNYRGQFIKVGGVGMVAVDLIHKKKGIAKELLQFFLKRCDEQDQTFAILYPFRPDFYFKMGFGYGTPMNTYSFVPTSLPFTPQREGWCYLGHEDLPLIADCYRRVAEKQHGYCLRNTYELEAFRRRYLKQGVLIGYKVQGRLEGYLYFTSEKILKDHFLRHYMRIKEWVYTSTEAFQVLCNFLYVQADQYEMVEFETQQPEFYYVLKDVRHTNRNIAQNIAHESYSGGLGIMYRIVNVAKFLDILVAKYNFNMPNVTIVLTVDDTFVPENNNTFYLKVINGKLKICSTSQEGIMLKINIAELSSLIMGSVRLDSLHRLAKVDCKESDVELLSQFFNTLTVPQCITAF